MKSENIGERSVVMNIARAQRDATVAPRSRDAPLKVPIGNGNSRSPERERERTRSLEVARVASQIGIALRERERENLKAGSRWEFRCESERVSRQNEDPVRRTKFENDRQDRSSCSRLLRSDLTAVSGTREISVDALNRWRDRRVGSTRLCSPSFCLPG